MPPFREHSLFTTAVEHNPFEVEPSDGLHAGKLGLLQQPRTTVPPPHLIHFREQGVHRFQLVWGGGLEVQVDDVPAEAHPALLVLELHSDLLDVGHFPYRPLPDEPPSKPN